jgi:hypothetical protein
MTDFGRVDWKESLTVVMLVVSTVRWKVVEKEKLMDMLTVDKLDGTMVVWTVDLMAFVMVEL